MAGISLVSQKFIINGKITREKPTSDHFRSLWKSLLWENKAFKNTSIYLHVDQKVTRARREDGLSPGSSLPGVQPHILKICASSLRF
ncbi:hypothetical protein E2C01_000190 [Portunus trituberculatus]|uniref:Uncharacterized protein n=1 Tax=Portunus trituberculatus TaxID=210409 RepID=A0A5B7CGM9_PORTR|nr:hypothetical protein [Portunus trituberculatus]